MLLALGFVILAVGFGACSSPEPRPVENRLLIRDPSGAWSTWVSAGTFWFTDGGGPTPSETSVLAQHFDWLPEELTDSDVMFGLYVSGSGRFPYAVVRVYRSTDSSTLYDDTLRRVREIGNRFGRGAPPIETVAVGGYHFRTYANDYAMFPVQHFLFATDRWRVDVMIASSVPEVTAQLLEELREHFEDQP